MSAFKFTLIILFAILVAVFAGKNMDLVEISFYDFQLNSHDIRVPLLIVILCSMGFGFAFAWIGNFFSQMKLKALIRKHEKSIEILQADLNKLQPPPPPPVPIPPGPPAAPPR